MVSLVMAVYNGGAHLNETLDGMMSQTYSDLEIIIVNDGSTDSTQRLLNSIKDKRVKVITLEKNSGAANALNIGIEQSRGEWIAIHDADDISLPNRIKEQIAYLSDHSKLVAAGSFIECFTDKDINVMNLSISNLQNYKNSIKTSDQVKAELFKGCPITHGSLVMSKEAFLYTGRYNPKYKIAYDYDLYMRLSAIGPIGNTPKILYRYRISSDSLSNLDVIETSNEFLMVAAKYIAKYCFEYKYKKPSVIVFGSVEGCKNFEEVMKAEKNLAVYGSVSGYNPREVLRAYYQYRKGLVDAFIVLPNAPRAEQLIRFLKGKGLAINKNYFRLWSAV